MLQIKLYVICLLEGTVCLLIAKTFLPCLFLHLSWRAGWTKWFSLFFFWCYFAANLIVCIVVLLCNKNFSMLLWKLVLIVQIFLHLNNFWMTFHWWFEQGVWWFLVDNLIRCWCMSSCHLFFWTAGKYFFLNQKLYPKNQVLLNLL